MVRDDYVNIRVKQWQVGACIGYILTRQVVRAEVKLNQFTELSELCRDRT